MRPEEYLADVEIHWCPGCGNFQIREALVRALAALDLPPHRVVLVTGIGQAAKIVHYLRVNGFDGLHGRTIAAAAGLKMVRPDLEVIAESGDGDLYGEGGNHLLHNIRRNLDITVIVHDNRVYGLTKGQASPTAPAGYITRAQPFGVLSRPLNPLALALALGAGFVAQAFSGEVERTAQILAAAIRYRGFALVNVLHPCPSWNRVQTFAWYKERIGTSGKGMIPRTFPRRCGWRFPIRKTFPWGFCTSGRGPRGRRGIPWSAGSARSPAPSHLRGFAPFASGIFLILRPGFPQFLVQDSVNLALGEAQGPGSLFDGLFGGQALGEKPFIGREDLGFVAPDLLGFGAEKDHALAQDLPAALEFPKDLGRGPAHELLVDFGELPGHHRGPFRIQLRQDFQGGEEAVGGFEEDHRRRDGKEFGKKAAALPDFPRGITGKEETVRREPGSHQGREHRRRPGNGHHRNPLANAGPHQREARIGNEGRSRIGNEGYLFPRPQKGQNPLHPLLLHALVEACGKGGGDAVMGKEFSRAARVLRDDQVRFPKDLEGPEGDVSEVANGCGAKVKDAGHFRDYKVAKNVSPG
jgi:2-oxoglutarate ferredoxin oxidoreductase subunit beta